MRPIDLEPKPSGLTPCVSSSILDDDDFTTDDESSEESSSQVSGQRISNRRTPPRQSSLVYNGNHRSPNPSPRIGPTEDDRKYFEAYWARIHERRRADLHSLPLVPYTNELYGRMDRRSEYRPSSREAHAYQNSTYHRRPLIDFVQNEWKKHPSSPGTSSSDINAPSWSQIIISSLFRRSLLIIIVFWFSVWFGWEYWAGSEGEERTVLNNALQGRFRAGQNMFGTNTRPAFKDMIHMSTLNQDLIPRKGENTRVIIIGDVHGCADELVGLLTKVSYNAGHDHIIFAGDMISKGPSSASVIKLAMSMKASCVRGNHEDRVLLAHRDINSHSISLKSLKKEKLNPPDPSSEKSGNPASGDGSLDAELFSHGNGIDRELAGSFSQKQIDYLASCPVILRLGQIRGMGEVHVVHAGLVPGVKLERQDPTGVMNMRTIDMETHVPSRGANGTPWNKLWDKYQTYLPKKDRSTVIYGHDSRRGLQLTRYTKGIDTGCVKGGKLTALVLTGDEDGTEPRTVSVDCKDYRSLKIQQEEKLGTLGQS